MDEKCKQKGGYLIINSGQELETSYTLPISESLDLKEDLSEILEELK